MKRFILLSFLFLGWAFYEMSGGADFDAEAIRTARLAALEAEKPQETAADPVVVAAAPKVVVDTDPPAVSSAATAQKAPGPTEVTRVSLNLTSVTTPVTPERTAVEAALAEALDTPRDTVPQNVGQLTSSADTPAIIPSLIDPNDGVAAAETQVGFADIRTVSGNRVNVRGGPGTNYSVVARLVRGDEVKVLEDNGNGWVRFETVDGSADGWVADFLLADG